MSTNYVKELEQFARDGGLDWEIEFSGDAFFLTREDGVRVSPMQVVGETETDVRSTISLTVAMARAKRLVGDGSNKKAAQATSQPRERASGRFGFEGKFARVCRCGHVLGVHAAEAPHPCINEDQFVDGATGVTCGCTRFRRRDDTKASRPE
jgi:hypothetical protein